MAALNAEYKNFVAVENQAEVMAKHVITTAKALYEASRNGLYDAEELTPEVRGAARTRRLSRPPAPPAPPIQVDYLLYLILLPHSILLLFPGRKLQK